MVWALGRNEKVGCGDRDVTNNYIVAFESKNSLNHYFLPYSKSEKNCHSLICFKLNAKMKRPIIKHSNSERRGQIYKQWPSHVEQLM